MNKLLFMPLLLVLLPLAFAEEATIQVPFDSHGTQCTFNQETIEYTCIWQGLPTKMTIENLEEFRDVLTQEQYQLALLDILEATVIRAPVDDPKTELEEKIEKLLETNSPNEAIHETIKALKTLNRICELGIEEGARMQTYATFILPDQEPHVDGAFNLANYPDLKRILMKIEECNYWNDYRSTYLTQYLDMDMINPQHIFTATWTYPDSPSYDNSYAAMCGNNLYGESTKENYCYRPSEYLRPGVIEYKSDVYKAYSTYLSGDESEQLRKNILDDRLQESKAIYGGND